MPDDAMAENRAQYALSWTLLPPLQRSTRLCHECADPTYGALQNGRRTSQPDPPYAPAAIGRCHASPRLPSRYPEKPRGANAAGRRVERLLDRDQ